MSIIRYLATLAAASTALAHDFWIQPTTFAPATGQVIGVGLRVGDEFPGQAVTRDDSRIARFVAIGPSMAEPREVVGRDGRDPAGLVRFASPGVHVLAYQSTPTPVTLPAAKFEAYLKEEGLEHISRIRAERGASGQEGREIYSRSVKSVVAVEGRHSAGFDVETGLRFEIVPLSDPTALKAGGTLRVRLLFERKPMKDALITARSPASITAPIAVRTDEKGEGEIVVPAAGMWLLSTVEMAAAPAGSGADWESVWTSLSFATADSTESNGTPATR